jgi:hypothetical protein
MAISHETCDLRHRIRKAAGNAESLPVELGTTLVVWMSILDRTTEQTPVNRRAEDRAASE